MSDREHLGDTFLGFCLGACVVIIVTFGCIALLAWSMPSTTTPPPPPAVQTWEYTPSMACGGGGKWVRVR